MTALLEAVLNMLNFALVVVDQSARMHFKTRLASTLLETPRSGLAEQNEIFVATPTEGIELKQAVRLACREGRGSGIRLTRSGEPPQHWLVALLWKVPTIRLART
jgi:hypothetical protein